jgi:hypothetical protein
MFINIPAIVLLKIQVFWDVTLCHRAAWHQRCGTATVQNIRNYTPNDTGITCQNSSILCTQATIWTNWHLLSEFTSGLPATIRWDHRNLRWTLHHIRGLCIFQFPECQVSAAVPEDLKILLTLILQLLALHLNAWDALFSTQFILQNTSLHLSLSKRGIVTHSLILKIQATNT